MLLPPPKSAQSPATVKKLLGFVAPVSDFVRSLFLGRGVRPRRRKSKPAHFRLGHALAGLQTLEARTCSIRTID